MSIAIPVRKEGATKNHPELGSDLSSFFSPTGVPLETKLSRQPGHTRLSLTGLPTPSSQLLNGASFMWSSLDHASLGAMAPILDASEKVV